MLTERNQRPRTAVKRNWDELSSHTKEKCANGYIELRAEYIEYIYRVKSEGRFPD